MTVNALYLCEDHFIEWNSEARNAFDDPLATRPTFCIIKWLEANLCYYLWFKAGERVLTYKFRQFYESVCQLAERSILLVYLIDGIHKDARKLIVRLLAKHKDAWIEPIRIEMGLPDAKEWACHNQ